MGGVEGIDGREGTYHGSHCLCLQMSLCIIMISAIKLEWENNEFVRARLLLTKARERASSERVWLKAALLGDEMLT
jgi:hypothetical protein